MDRRAAFGAERLWPLGATVAGLDVDLKLARAQLEAALLGKCDGAKRRAGKSLTVGAMADDDLFRIDLGLVRDVAAVTTPVDLHRPLPPVRVTATAGPSTKHSQPTLDGRMAPDNKPGVAIPPPDRKSTRLNSSHIQKSRMPSSA